MRSSVTGTRAPPPKFPIPGPCVPVGLAGRTFRLATTRAVRYAGLPPLAGLQRLGAREGRRSWTARPRPSGAEGATGLHVKPADLTVHPRPASKKRGGGVMRTLPRHCLPDRIPGVLRSEPTYSFKEKGSPRPDPPWATCPMYAVIVERSRESSLLGFGLVLCRPPEPPTARGVRWSWAARPRPPVA